MAMAAFLLSVVISNEPHLLTVDNSGDEAFEFVLRAAAGQIGFKPGLEIDISPRLVVANCMGPFVELTAKCQRWGQCLVVVVDVSSEIVASFCDDANDKCTVRGNDLVFSKSDVIRCVNPFCWCRRRVKLIEPILS